MESSLPVEGLAALAADSHAARLAARGMVDVVRHAHGLVAAGAHQQNLGCREGAFALRNAALDLLGRIGPGVPLDHHDVLHQDLAGPPVHAQHAAALSLVAAGDHLDGVFLPQIDANRLSRLSFCDSHQITSGASEIIFMNFFSRNSRATGPKIRVPRGFNSLSMMTTALLSKRRYEPSLRPMICLVRTTTASHTSPFFTWPSGAATLMWTLITSPTPA